MCCVWVYFKTVSVYMLVRCSWSTCTYFHSFLNFARHVLHVVFFLKIRPCFLLCGVTCTCSFCASAACLHVLGCDLRLVWSSLSGGGSGSCRSLFFLFLRLRLQRQPVLRHFSSGTFLWHHKFLHFLWPALGGYKGHTWPVIVCLALSSASLLRLPVTSSAARLSDCLKTVTSLGCWANKKRGVYL